MRIVSALFCLSVVVGLILLVGETGRTDIERPSPALPADHNDIDQSVARLNEWFRGYWARESVRPSEPADDLTIYRRLSLALHGTIPSLEEIRSFEADKGRHRIERWTRHLMLDARFADYFAERLARSLVGSDMGPFIIFRRDRLTAWIREQLRSDTPWTEMTRQMIAAEGLWTDQPAANFITAANVNGEGIDENMLVGRTVRTFLGQRIDCAQCHDHPFDEMWKQHHFEGLAAFYGQAHINFGGVQDRRVAEGQEVEYRVVMAGIAEEEGRVVEPAVPFSPEWLPADGTRRQRLAEWVTHPENRRYERAIANRIWGLLYGRPWHDPVDDLPHPSQDSQDPDALDLLGQSFRSGGSRLSILIRTIAASDVFRLSSASDAADEAEFARQSQNWGVFPLVRLRPEQVIGSLFQAGRIRTVDQNSHPFVRLQRFGNEGDFLKEYGDQGDDELLQQVGTIPQALLRMNGRFTRELSETGGFSAAGQILAFSQNDEDVIDNCFLACLSRRPDPEERQWFAARLSEAAADPDDAAAVSQEEPIDPPGSDTGETQRPLTREEIVRDLYWTLFNSPEFSWNH